MNSATATRDEPAQSPFLDSLPADAAARLSLCDSLDRILNRGAVVAGEVVISVAGVDLLYLELRLLLSSVETLHRARPPQTEENHAPGDD